MEASGVPFSLFDPGGLLRLTAAVAAAGEAAAFAGEATAGEVALAAATTGEATPAGEAGVMVAITGEVVAELAETSGEGGDIADMDMPLVVGTISGVCTGVGGNDDGRSTWGAADAPPARFAALPGLE